VPSSQLRGLPTHPEQIHDAGGVFDPVDHPNPTSAHDDGLAHLGLGRERQLGERHTRRSPGSLLEALHPLGHGTHDRVAGILAFDPLA